MPERLHSDVQRWIWKKQWTNLRDIQQQSIDPILCADRDVIISASTASGKTEAAFLPACSYMVTTCPAGIGILYISPLKALINDQHKRLQTLAGEISFSLTSWHGDANTTAKKRIKNHPLVLFLLHQSRWNLSC